MAVVDKDIPSNQKLLGQFFTPKHVAEYCLSKISYQNWDLIIEPSFGEGVFLNLLENENVIGCEIDSEVYKKYKGKKITQNINFYDFSLIEEYKNKKVLFIGNPPYRSPAPSINSHSEHINYLRKKYNIGGIREEAVLFLLNTFDIVEKNNLVTDIHYILPNAIFKNNSKVFTKFLDCINEKYNIYQVISIGKEFKDVSRNLSLISFTNRFKTEIIKLDDCSITSSVWLGSGKNIIKWQDIFIKTYLGSVPCQNLFMSCKGEDLEHFMNRLKLIFSHEKLENFIQLLKFNDNYNSKTLQKNNEDKIKSIFNLRNLILSKVDLNKLLIEINNYQNYKNLFHNTNDIRLYFRCNLLKNIKGLTYQINSKPGKALTFPGNPSNTGKDHFTYIDYDINRNSSPGAQRCVLIEDIESNLTQNFINWWNSNTNEPLIKALDYIKNYGNSEEYKVYKKQNERFYFGIPQIFDPKYL